jgi:hypothetical protein
LIISGGGPVAGPFWGENADLSIPGLAEKFGRTDTVWRMENLNRRTFLASLGAIVALPKVTSANPPVAESWSPPPIEFTALAGEPIVQGDLVVWTERFAGHEIVRRVTCSEEFSVACQRSRAGVAITTATAWAKVLIRTQGQMLVRVEGSVLR